MQGCGGTQVEGPGPLSLPPPQGHRGQFLLKTQPVSPKQKHPRVSGCAFPPHGQGKACRQRSPHVGARGLALRATPAARGGLLTRPHSPTGLGPRADLRALGLAQQALNPRSRPRRPQPWTNTCPEMGAVGKFEGLQGWWGPRPGARGRHGHSGGCPPPHPGSSPHGQRGMWAWSCQIF